MKLARSVRDWFRRDEDWNVERQVREALRRRLTTASNCVDVGASSGDLLEHMVQLAPRGRHVAIEPLPAFAARLRKRFPSIAVHQLALADADGVSEFHFVPRTPGYSGLERRRYEREDEAVERISVRTSRLDGLLDPGQRVDAIKIDVEGGELGVLRGARRVLAGDRPFVIFEHGLGAADFYGTTPGDVYALLVERLGYRIFTLDGWLAGRPALTLAEMQRDFETCRGYMYVAEPGPTP